MRNIMHDYQDQKCIEILRHIMAAMSDDSVILIDEMVVPIKDAHWHVTSLDLTMMATLASTERTEKQWQTLFDSAGLKIVNIYTYTEQLQFSIMVAVPKGRDPWASRKGDSTGLYPEFLIDLAVRYQRLAWRAELSYHFYLVDEASNLTSSLTADLGFMCWG